MLFERRFSDMVVDSVERRRGIVGGDNGKGRFQGWKADGVFIGFRRVEKEISI